MWRITTVSCSEKSLSEGRLTGGFKEAKKQGFLPVTGTAGNVGEKDRVNSVLSGSVPRIAESAGERERKRMDPGQKTLILHASPTRGGLDHPTDWVDEIDHADPAMIHPKAAEGLGLRDGDWVMLTGPAGSVKTRVRLTEGIHPEVGGHGGRDAGQRIEGTLSGRDGPAKGTRGATAVVGG